MGIIDELSEFIQCREPSSMALSGLRGRVALERLANDACDRHALGFLAHEPGDCTHVDSSMGMMAQDV